MSEDKELVREWFLLPTFYYDTENPDIVKPDKIDYILDFSSSYVCLLEERQELGWKPVGLLDFFFSLVNGKISIDFQFADPGDWERIGGVVLKKLTDYFTTHFHHHKIIKNVYAFDTGALKVFEDSVFFKEGVYPSLIYKDRKYWDVYSFALFNTNEK